MKGKPLGKMLEDNLLGYKKKVTQIDAQMFINEKKGKIGTDYEVLNVVGRGGYGEVKKVVHKLTNEVRAMKIIHKDSFDEWHMKSLSNEISILK
mmetsp:Transcript_916/g.929  ORF Transcript_916/g.929 Transcript_916/m.929 type:complete len:94 (+) Transcript_916:674-955(+)